MSKYRSALLASLTACLLTSNLLWASDTSSGKEPSSFDLNTLTCKEVMILSGNDRDVVVSFLLGYFSGHAKATELNVATLTHATNKFLDSCLDNPTANALITMQAAMSE